MHFINTKNVIVKEISALSNKNISAVKGLERVRCMCQNDAHLFVTPEQIKEEFKKVVGAVYTEKTGKTADFYVVEIGDGPSKLA